MFLKLLKSKLKSLFIFYFYTPLEVRHVYLVYLVLCFWGLYSAWNFVKAIAVVGELVLKIFLFIFLQVSFGIFFTLDEIRFYFFISVVESDFELLSFIKASNGLIALISQYFLLQYLSRTNPLMYSWEELLQGFLY